MISAREYEEIQRERLRAKLSLAVAELDAGQGDRRSAQEVIAAHKAQSQ